MRAAVVYFGGKKDNAIRDIANGLARGIESQGHQVDVIDADRDEQNKLARYEYIALGSISTSMLGGKVAANISEYLANSGSVSGKRCFAFVKKSGIRIRKTLQKLMQLMEQEGMILKFSDILSSAEYGEAIGKKLHITRKQ